MGLRIKEQSNGQTSGPQPLDIDPMAVIDSLMQRVQELTVECVMKDALIAQLQVQMRGADGEANVKEKELTKE